jgi:hypothetical protein
LGRGLEQRLSVKLEEISRVNPSLADTLRILHQLHKAELYSHKPEAADQSLMSLREKVKALTAEVVKAGHLPKTTSSKQMQLRRSP